MLFLTQKSAKRFNLPWKELETLEGDGWKVDVYMHGRIPLLLMTHGATLFTLVRRKKDLPTLDHIVQEIALHCPWYPISESTSVGKSGNRQVTGSMNEMKWQLEGMVGNDSVFLLTAMERRINDMHFSCIDYDNPQRRVLHYLKERDR